MNLVWYLLIFFLGSSVGSFLNVLVTRTIDGEKWITGRSKCDHCGKILAWYDMIPVVSYLIYRGKSRCCKKSLDYQHLVVEILTGLLFVWWSALSSVFFLLVTEPGQTIQPLFWLLMGLVMLSVVISDQYYGVIPLPFLGVGFALIVIYRLILIYFGTYMLVDLGWSVVAGLVMSSVYVLLRMITKGRGMGEGDAWLAIYLGFLVGWSRVYIATMTAFVSGAVVGILLIILGMKTRKDTIPFGPYMVLGAIVSLIWG